MEFVEEQVADLRSYLPPARTLPVPVAALISPPAASPSPGSASSPPIALPAHSPATNNKRGPEDDSLAPKQQRSKRNRYISIACTQCKRRKIKCNGQDPCQRCGHLGFECLYTTNCCPSFKETEEYKNINDRITGLEQLGVNNRMVGLEEGYNNLNHRIIGLEELSVNDRIASLEEICKQLPNLELQLKWLEQQNKRLLSMHREHSPGPQSTIEVDSPSQALLPVPRAMSIAAPSTPDGTVHGLEPPTFSETPRFSGPTSSAFGVDVAKSSLYTMSKMGYTTTEHNKLPQEDMMAISPAATLHTSLPPPRSPMATHDWSGDPFWLYSKEEILRLCRVHEGEIGTMYPVFKMEDLLTHARRVANWMEATRHNEPTSLSDDNILETNDTLLLKVVMCCALLLEGHGYSPKAAELFETIRPVLDRKMGSDDSEVSALPMLGLSSAYRFLSGDELRAWRVLGNVSRLCLELGLHRVEGVQRIPQGQVRKNAIMTFWSTYILDRRWSFGTGLPYVLQDDSIDPRLIELVSRDLPDEYPFVSAMIKYSRLGAKIWKLVDYKDPATLFDLKRDEFEALDREILDWYDNLPAEVKVEKLDVVPLASGPKFNLQRMQMWTRLRMNQMRMWLHAPVLHSASSIQNNLELAQLAVDLARETMQFMKKLDEKTLIYRSFQVYYHQFLTTPLTIAFLALVHAPVDFSSLIRADYNVSMALIKDMSTNSCISKRLWEKVRTQLTDMERLGINGIDGIHGGLGRYDPVRGDQNRAVSVSGLSSTSSAESPMILTPGPSSSHPLSSSATHNAGLNALLDPELVRTPHEKTAVGLVDLSGDVPSISMGFYGMSLPQTSLRPDGAPAAGHRSPRVP